MSAAIRTFTGHLVVPSQLRVEDVSLLDLAHHLSQLCRFTGATRDFYSVAQHSWLVADRLHEDGASTTRQAIGLLHDAAEAYINDLASPVKYDPAFSLDAYRATERTMQTQIYTAFQLDPTPFDTDAVKQVDQDLYHAEARDLMAGSDDSHAYIANRKQIRTIRPKTPREAEQWFLRRALELNLRSPRP